MAAYGNGRGNLIVIDFDKFEDDSSAVMHELNDFLGLRSFKYSVEQVFNSRKNRGVHATTINGVSRGKLGDLDPWTASLGNDVVKALRTYFRPCNKELEKLLGSSRKMSWLQKYS